MHQHSCCFTILLLISGRCLLAAASSRDAQLNSTAGRLTPADATNEFLTIADLPLHQYQLFLFFSGGLSQLLWQNESIAASISSNLLSTGCRDALVLAEAEIDRGSEWAFRFLDAGSKSPSGMLDGTLTSFGDYDECLAIEKTDFVGKYCGIELRYTTRKDSSERLEIDDLLSRSVPSFKHVNLNLGICVPSLCSGGEVKSLLKTSLQNLPFEIVNTVTCDTAETTSWTAKINQMTTGQVVAAAGLAAFVAAAIAGSHVHAADALTRALANTPVREYVWVPQVVDFLMHFSIVKSVVSLVTVRKAERFVTFAELSTLILVVGTTYAQAAFLFESMPLGLNVMHRSHDLRKLVSYLSVQPFFSDGFYGILPFVAGYVTLQTCQRVRSLNPVTAILRKYIKLASACGLVIALDYLWPILSQGPFYGRVSDQVLDKCSKTWWTHIVMIANFNDINQTCAPHMTYASIQMQLFPVGLVLSTLLIKTPKIGFRVTVIAAILALLNAYANAFKLQSPVLFDKDLNLAWTAAYIHIVLLSFPSQSVNYLFGLLAAYALPSTSQVSSGKVRRLEVVAGGLLMTFALYANVLHHSFSLIPKASIPLFVIGVKLSCCAGCTLLCKAWQAWNEAAELEENEESTAARNQNEPDGANVSNNNINASDLSATASETPDEIVVSFRKALVRLSFTTFLVSFFIIRLDYFSSRLLYSVSIYDTIKRLLYSSFYTFWAGFYLHLFFMSPLKALRDTVFGDVLPIPTQTKKTQ